MLCNDRLIKKELTDGQYVKEGSWDSIHIVEVSEPDDGVYTYKVTTTVMVSLTVTNKNLGSCNLSGSLIRDHSSKGELDTC